MNVTELELKGLEGICNSDYHDGAVRINNPVWTWSANPFNNLPTFSGIMSSLVKKGLAGADGNTKDACVWITKVGMDVLKDKGLAKEHWYK